MTAAVDLPVLRSIRFWVSGQARAQGNKSIVQPHGALHARLIERKSAVLKSWRQEASSMARVAAAEAGWTLLREATLRVLFAIARPPSHLTSKGLLKASAPIRPRGKPDTDKLVRAIGDALTGILVTDDSAFVTLSAHKRYTRGEAGAMVIVEPAGDEVEAELLCGAPIGVES